MKDLIYSFPILNYVNGSVCLLLSRLILSPSPNLWWALEQAQRRYAKPLILRQNVEFQIFFECVTNSDSKFVYVLLFHNTLTKIASPSTFMNLS